MILKIALLKNTAWQKNTYKAALTKKGIEGFGWKYDPNNPLNIGS